MMRWLIAVSVLALLSACVSPAQKAAEQAKRDKAVDTQLQLGAHYLVRGQLNIAKTHFDRALEIDPDSSKAMDKMALLHWRLRQYPEAEKHFRRAVETDSKNFAAYHNYGAFLCDRGRYDEGIRVLEKAANNLLYPYAADANVNAGVCMLRKPAHRLAEKYFREALRLQRDHPGALLQMARLSFYQGKTLRARAFIQRYYQPGAARDTPESLLLAYRIETAMRDRNAAASYALRLRSKFPDSDEAQRLELMKAGKRRRK